MLPSQSPAITIKDLTVTYHQKPVLWDLDLTVPEKTILGIVGPNGSGKTTLLKSILGIIKPLAGTITVHPSASSDRSRSIAYVPQKNSVDWTFPVSVQDVVMMGRFDSSSWFYRPSQQDYEIVDQALGQVGMQGLKDRRINQLSGGQQQRVFIARALAQQSEILILDEPFNGIDNTTQHMILQLFKTLQSTGKTIIVVHHDLTTVQQFFDWTFLMNVKHIAAGPTSLVLTEHNIAKTFYTPFQLTHDAI